MVWLSGQGLGRKEHYWKIDDKKSGDVCERDKNMKILVSHINAHQRMTSTKEDFSNQVDRVTYSINTSQSLSPAPTPSWHSGHHAQAQEHELLLTKANLAAATAECPVCRQQRLTPSPWPGTVPQGDQPATQGQTDYSGPLPSGKGQCCVLTGRDTFWRFGFTVSPHSHKPILSLSPHPPHPESYVMSPPK